MKKLLFTALLTVFAFPAYAADECVIVARKLDQPIYGDFVPVQGDHIGTGTIDQGNSESYVIPEGSNYVTIYNNSSTAVWFKISSDAASAVVDTDEFLPAYTAIDRGSITNVIVGKTVKCVNDS
jgi:hypothetical protein